MLIPYHFFLHFVFRRNKGIEIQDGAIHFVMEITFSIFLPFLLQIAGCNSDLIGTGTTNTASKLIQSASLEI